MNFLAIPLSVRANDHAQHYDVSAFKIRGMGFPDLDIDVAIGDVIVPERLALLRDSWGIAASHLL